MDQALMRVGWETVGCFPDCAYAAVGVRRLVDDDTWVSHRLPFLHVRRSGYEMVYARAECDGLPIEVGRISGEIVAVRLEFTNDVSDLERAGRGNWTALGRLRIGRQGAIATDKKEQEVQGWVHQVALPPGWYTAETFATKDDDLGVRLVADTWQGPGQT